MLKFENTVQNYRLPKQRDALRELFDDLAELVTTADLDAALAAGVTDTLVRFGAQAKVVELFGAKSGGQVPRPIHIKSKNGVDVNHSDLQECLCQWRVAAFLDPDFRGAFPGIIAGTGWFESIEHLIGALYCCDGRARRAKADSNEVERIACRDQLNSQVLGPLRFTLQQRVDWKDSYAIPENALPRVNAFR